MAKTFDPPLTWPQWMAYCWKAGLIATKADIAAWRRAQQAKQPKG